jgi:ribonuclease P protein component
VYLSGVRHRVGDIVVIRAGGDLGPAQVGIVTGRRVGNAVRRNRVRRRLREAAARIRLRPDTAYVIVAGPRVADVDFSRLVDWLGRAVDESAGDEDA